MGIGNFAQDWDEVDEQGKDDGYSGGGGNLSENDRLYKFRFSIPKIGGSKYQPNLVPGRPAKKRVVFLPYDKIFTIYEHAIFNNQYASKIVGFNTVCIPKSSADWRGGPCPICSNKDMKSYARFHGFFGVIDMGQVERIGKDDISLYHASWKDKNGNEHWRKFEKVLLAAPKGTNDKPGLLSTLKWKAGDMGISNLSGTVWDATRTGDKTSISGDDWQFVCQLEEGGIMDYLVQHGANADEVDITPPLFLQTDPSKVGSEPGIFNFDLDELYKKQQVAAGVVSPVVASNRSNVSGAGYGDQGGGYNSGNDAPPPDDDDIPF